MRCDERPWSDVGAALRASRLFEGSDDAAVRDGASVFTPIRYGERRPIHHQGDRARDVYVLLRGIVRIGQLSENGREYTVRVVGPGETFGYEPLFGETVRRTTAATLEACTLAVCRADLAAALLLRHPLLALNIARSLRDQYERALVQVQAATSSRVGERLLALLDDLAAKYGVPERHGTRIETPLTQEQLASLIGTTRETLSCELSKLARRGEITRCGRSIVVRSRRARVA